MTQSTHVTKMNSNKLYRVIGLLRAIIISLPFIVSSCYNNKPDAIYNIPDKDSIHIVLQEWNIEDESDSIVLRKCNLKSYTSKKLYLEVKCDMPFAIILNGDTLQKWDIQGLNIFTAELNSGENILEAYAKVRGFDRTFEVSVYDSLSVIQLYAEGQSCNIIYPIIPSDTKDIMLTNAHQNVASLNTELIFSDTHGNIVSRIYLKKDSMTYRVHNLKKDISYMCTMKIGNTIVRQPILCGNDDDALKKFSLLRGKIPDDHPRANEIDGVLYRLAFLLKHPSRYAGDWWWQFKISPLTYQLEYIFTHLNQTYGESNDEFNVKFITYKSAIDDSLQRYLLVTPNEINKKLPLVVIIRPFCENPHHFFASPQIARQWALNIVQGLANHYGYMVMMPEGRMQLNEDLTPIAEQEIKLAISDVEKHYNVDKNKIYLHANCTGGYRALKLAESNPRLFSAIALYAPVYKITFNSDWSKRNTAQADIGKLRGIPLMIHYDPLDTHVSPSQFKNLIEDCNTNGIPLTISVKENSGKFYNVVIAGDEAFEFFNNKQKH